METHAQLTRPMVSDDDRFMRIVERTSQITCHRQLFELLQGKEIQFFIPHQVLISAWGDFDGQRLQHDVISALPGLRTGQLKRCTIDDLLQDLYKRWDCSGRQPLVLDGAMDSGLAHSSGCDCALHQLLQGVCSLLVHAITDVRDGNVSLYLAVNANPIVNSRGSERFRRMVDPLITQIDVAFRRIAALTPPVLPADRQFPANPGMLSDREREILLLVSEGGTNHDISNLLAISVFTVKNHLHLIMQKLNAGNRTEAVAHYHQMELMPRRIQVTGESAPDHISRFHA